MAALLVEVKHFNLGAGNMIDFADFLDSTMRQVERENCSTSGETI
jgi:hypothetical protein